MSVTVTGEAPPPCSGFTLTSLGEKRAVLYGGWDGASHFSHLFLAELKRNSVVSDGQYCAQQNFLALELLWLRVVLFQFMPLGT